MIDTQAIRNKVLELALRGELSEQLDSDGTADDLYCHIQQEKEKKKTAKGSKKKKIIPIEKKNIPYEIPSNWKWIRWGDLSESIQYGYNTPAKQSGRVKMVRISDIQDNKVLWDTVPYCDIAEDDIDSYLLHENDILFARTGGTVGKSYIVTDVPEKAVFAGYLIRTSYSSLLCARYMKFFMESRLYWKQLQNGTTATAQPNCNAQTLSKMMLPLPPASEQTRIVDKIEAIFIILDKIDTLQEQYASNQEAMKSKIIDAAIQGKLTEQLMEDGTAEETYIDIQKEKEQLVRDEIIKKEKASSTISEEEILFDIPDTWKWVRLKDICTKIVDGDHNPPRGVKEKTEYKMLSAQNINNDRIENPDKVRYLSECVFWEEDKRTQLKKDDVLLTIVGTIGRSCVYQGGENYCFQRSVSVITTLAFSQYLKYVFDVSYIQKFMETNATGAAQLGFYLNKLEKLIIPLPPYKEQIRIAEKTDQLLALIR